MLERLQKGSYIEFSALGDDRLVKYKVCNWTQNNKVLDYNCPCQKDSGFFFLPVHIAAEFILAACCSEVDMLLDLWICTVYRDPEVEGSFTAPVVYLRNYSGSPLLSYADLAKRWGLPKATVGRVMLKLSRVGYLTLLAFSRQHGDGHQPQRLPLHHVPNRGYGGRADCYGRCAWHPCTALRGEGGKSTRRAPGSLRLK